MKQRYSSHTTLMELTAALLVFMLASVTILGLFTTAFESSRQAGYLVQATALAQDCAALISAGRSSGAQLEAAGYAKKDESTFQREIEGGWTVNVLGENKRTAVGELYEGRISVWHEGETVFELPVCRYYNKEVIRP